MSRRTSTRPHAVSSPSFYSTDLRQAIRQFLPRSGLALVVNDDKLRWVPRMLVSCAILMTWDLAGMISDAFERARGVLLKMYCSRRRPGESYGGFMATLAHQTAKHLALLVPTLRGHVRALAESMRRDCWINSRRFWRPASIWSDNSKSMGSSTGSSLATRSTWLLAGKSGSFMRPLSCAESSPIW